jgi:ABC-type transport system involved in multi-copper enzyme maturation permease subunit
MRLVRAELLKLRRRQATYVILALALVITGLIYIAVGRGLGGFACQFEFGGSPFGEGSCLVEFPGAYALADQFAFAFGGLLAIVYAAAFVGGDWSWGVVRNVIARGEGRGRYLLGKAGALAIVLAVGVSIIFVFALVMTYLSAALNGIPVASPLRGRGTQDFLENLGLGYVVVLERAALGFAVAVVLRSQLAGAVVGVVLYVGEGILTTLLTIFSLARNIGDGGFTGNVQPIGPQWFQYLPISIGGQVLNAAPGASSNLGTGGVEGIFLRPVPLELALPALAFYLVVAIGIAIFALNRQEIT